MQKESYDIDFETRFYEGLIQKKPDFIEALKLLGELYTKRGLYRQGLAIDERLAHLQPQDPLIFYNLACSYSLLNDTDKALRAIKRAFSYGYNNFDYLEQDQDLINLRNDGRFQRYFARIRPKVEHSKK